MKNPRKKLLPWGIGRAIDSLQKVDDRGLFYTMEYKANYYSLEKYAAALANAKPGCSTFVTKNNENETIFGRNYDYSHYRNNKKSKDPNDITSLMILVKTNNPKAKYKTIGMVDGFWFDFKNGTWFEGVPSDGKTDVTYLAMAPFIIMDGINEKGLATSIMHLQTEVDWQPVDYIDPESLEEKDKENAIILENANEEPQRLDYKARSNAYAINIVDKKTWKANKNLATNQNEPGKPKTMHPILMRKMLDYCASVDEAVEMAKSYNIVSPMPDADYHIMLADRSGKSVILEWVNNQLVVQEINHSTNYYLTREDHYGYGLDRDEILVEALKNPTITEEECMKVLEKASQNPYLNEKAGFTEWSCVYNLAKNTLKLSIFLDYNKQYEYKI